MCYLESMKRLKPVILMMTLALAARGAPASRDGERAGGRKRATVRAEGVTESAQTAPLAAVRQAAERISGRHFTVTRGRYVNLAEPVIIQFDTEYKELISVQKLPTGLYKAIVEIPVDAEPREDELKELTVRGEARIERSRLRARSKSKEDAQKQAVLAMVERLYPGRFPPRYLNGRVYYLETLSERIRDGKYLITARVRIKLNPP